jgi:hypothetical protein
VPFISIDAIGPTLENVIDERPGCRELAMELFCARNVGVVWICKIERTTAATISDLIWEATGILISIDLRLRTEDRT